MLLHSYIVARGEGKQTVAAFLRTKLNLPWSKAKELVVKKQVRVAGQPTADPAQRLKVGNRVEVHGFSPIHHSENPQPPASPQRKQGRDSSASPPPASPQRESPQRKQGRASSPIDHPASPPPASPQRKHGRDSSRIDHPASPQRESPQRKQGQPKPSYDGPMPTIVYQDNSVVIVNKPAGLTTMRHADEAAEFGERGKRFLPFTLADLLPALLGHPDKPLRAVHRIDRDTSGLVVFARTAKAEKALLEQFREHTIERRYLALVRGAAKAGKIESTLVRDRGDARRGSSADSPGQRAVTFVKIVEAFGNYTLVECRLETGRTHQVRIHLAEQGNPFCGERVYDRPLNGKPYPDESGAARPLLHAVKLGLRHPETGEKMSWTSPLDDDMARLIGEWRNDEFKT